MYDLEFWRKVEKDRNAGMSVTEACRNYNIQPATLRRARIKGLIDDKRRLTAKESNKNRVKLRAMDSNVLLELYIKNDESIKRILEILNMSLSGANIKCLKDIITSVGGILHKKTRVLTSPYSDEEFIRACKQVKTFTELAHILGVSSRTSNNEKFKKLIKKHNIDISNWGASSNRGKYTYEEIFCKNSMISRQKLRTYVLTFEVLDLTCCSKCGVSKWNGEQLLIQIDHINGDNRDNRLNNLRGLCPNCHSLTPTFCGKKRNKK